MIGEINNKRKPLLVFHLLVAYVFLQFCWWAWLIFDLHQVSFEYQMELMQLQAGSENIAPDQQRELKYDLKKRTLMIIGEGSVFLLMLVLGAVITRRSFNREVALARQQKNFLLSVTHELKSPIASVKLYLETLLKRKIEKEQENQMLNSALQENERLQGLVENLLIAARIENMEFTFDRKKLNLSELINQTLKENPVFSSGSHGLKLSIQPDVFITGDEFSLSIIVSNLLENAFKYSPPGSNIQVELENKDGRIKFAVKDEGKGIPKGEKKNIFRRFYRLGSEEVRETKGTGLGLFIVRFLAEKHNAQVLVCDNYPKGSIFEVRI